MILSSNSHYCPTNSPRPQNIQFNITEDKERQQIFTLELLEPVNYCLKTDVSNSNCYLNSCRLMFCWSTKSTNHFSSGQHNKMTHKAFKFIVIYSHKIWRKPVWTTDSGKLTCHFGFTCNCKLNTPLQSKHDFTLKTVGTPKYCWHPKQHFIISTIYNHEDFVFNYKYPN